MIKNKIQYEKQTVERMLMVYCKHKHKTQPCAECDALKNYAYTRLDKCRFGEAKPACKNCPIHCYQPEMRNKMREVMRFSGPRMLLYYPKDFIIHLLRK
jgi:superfamily II helicase